MNRKEIRGGGSRRGNDTDMRRKEKENRKLQLELRSEKEKLNSAIIKYQKEINEMQAVGALSVASVLFSAASDVFDFNWFLFLFFFLFAATVRRKSDAYRAADGSGQ